MNGPKYQRGIAAAAIPWVIAAVSAAAGTAGAVMSIRAGNAQASQAKMQARSEADSAKQQEINRRQQLLRALATQNAAAGAAGIQTDGSFGAGLRRQINQNQNDLLTIDSNNSSRQAQLAAYASNARAAGIGGAVTSVLDGAVGAMKAAPGSSAPKTDNFYASPG